MIDREHQLPGSSRRDITRPSSTLFIGKALDAISALTGRSMEELAHDRFRIIEAIMRAIAVHRDAREAEAYQRALLPQGGLEFETSSDAALIFADEGRYGYNQPYKGSVQFKNHLFRVIGDLEASGEEHDCAIALDNNKAIRKWVRNTVRQDNSFGLQTSSDKFYPDFVVLLADGRVLVVEYKGADRWADAAQDREIGALWADRSNGTCLFLVIKDRQFSQIDNAIHASR